MTNFQNYNNSNNNNSNNNNNNKSINISFWRNKKVYDTIIF